MIWQTLTTLDYLVIAFVMLSAAFALARGFVGEALGVVGWIGAIFAMLYGFSLVRPFAHRWIEIGFLADGASVLVLFVASLLIGSRIVRWIGNAIHASGLSGIDRILGFMFGALRGAIIVCLMYLGLTWVWAPADQPGWIRNAALTPALTEGAHWLIGLVPGSARDSGAEAVEDLRKRTETLFGHAARTEDSRGKSAVPEASKTAAPSAEKGYKDDERQRLEQLIQRNR